MFRNKWWEDQGAPNAAGDANAGLDLPKQCTKIGALFAKVKEKLRRKDDNLPP